MRRIDRNLRVLYVSLALLAGLVYVAPPAPSPMEAAKARRRRERTAHARGETHRFTERANVSLAPGSPLYAANGAGSSSGRRDGTHTTATSRRGWIARRGTRRGAGTRRTSGSRRRRRLKIERRSNRIGPVVGGVERGRWGRRSSARRSTRGGSAPGSAPRWSRAAAAAAAGTQLAATGRLAVGLRRLGTRRPSGPAAGSPGWAYRDACSRISSATVVVTRVRGVGPAGPRYSAPTAGTTWRGRRGTAPRAG